jgi:hypothetical protein
MDKDYRLAVTYLLPEEAASFEEEFDFDEEQVLLTRVDATNAEAMTSYFKDIAERWGNVHAICALVGGWAGGRDVDETDDVRFEPACCCCK